MRVAVLGAGLQGTCIALELVRRGIMVELVEQDAVPLNRASLRNEGKIHLGFVYANDPTLRTAWLMMRAALVFRRLLSGWTDGAFDRVRSSESFHYLVPHDSLRSPRELTEHYAALQQLYKVEVAQPGMDYLGARPPRLWRLLEEREFAPFTAVDRLQAGFATVEASIGLSETAVLLRRALAAHAGIRLRTDHRVAEVARVPGGFRVEGSLFDGTPWRLECDQVVNALWDGRLAIDRGLGLQPERPWVHRLKYRVLVKLPESLCGMPSLTFALGAYGDVAVYPAGQAYVSWYPECLRGWSADVEPPASWGPACAGQLARTEQLDLAQRILSEFDVLVPGLARAHVVTVDAGVIFAWGRTDITDLESELHRRDQTGTLSVDGYHSVNTGKLTTAPLYAVDTANRVVEAGGLPLPTDGAWAEYEPFPTTR